MEIAEFYDFTSSYPVGEVDESIQYSETGMELVLPGGKMIGHRSLAQIYRQKLKPLKEEEAVVQRLLTHYPTESKECMMPAKVKKALTNDVRVRQAFTNRIGERNNKLQKHFRAQILF